MPLGQNIIESGAAALAIGGRVRVRGGCYFEFAWDGELEIHDSSETCWLERLQVPFRRPSVQNIRCIRHGSSEESDCLFRTYVNVFHAQSPPAETVRTRPQFFESQE